MGLQWELNVLTNHHLTVPHLLDSAVKLHPQHRRIHSHGQLSFPERVRRALTGTRAPTRLMIRVRSTSSPCRAWDKLLQCELHLLTNHHLSVPRYNHHLLDRAMLHRLPVLTFELRMMMSGF